MNHPLHLLLLWASLLVSTPLVGQTTWSDFVNNNKNNPFLVDTFLLQTFQGNDKDNWHYQVKKGTASIKGFQDLTIASPHGPKALKITADGEVSFARYDITPYDSVHSYIHRYASIEGTDTFLIRIYRDNKNAPKILSAQSKDTFIPTTIQGNPQGLDVLTSQGMNANSFLLMDTVMAIGYSRKLTLFTGTGNWSSSQNWSHKPAFHLKNALIEGNVTVDGDVNCQSIQMRDGSIHLEEGHSLTTNKVILYDNSTSHASLISQGTLQIKDSLIVRKTFPEKGKWYFFSLPFDVYQVSGFTLKDETETGTGDYFYLQTYDSEQRAQGQSGWTVVKTASIANGAPIIQKNKGYLIALDAEASTTTLRFGTSANHIPDEFGKSGSWEIPYTQAGEGADAGWVLCGNPLPSPLPIKQIEGKEALDGYVYIYEDGTYKAYSLEEDYALAPYTSFFVKANEEVDLEVTTTQPTNQARLLSSDAFIQAAEPQVNPTQNTTIPTLQPVQIIQESDQIRIKHLPEQGVAQWLSVQGQVVRTEAVPQGTSILRYPAQSGLFLLHLRYGKHEQVVKCVR